MKSAIDLKNVLHVLEAGALLTVILAPLVALVGFLSGWRSSTEYSDGMFWMGAAVIIFGLLAVWGGFTSRGSFSMVYPQSVSDMSLTERGKLWMLDALRGYQTVAVMTVCGVLLIGTAVLVDKLFGS